MTYRRVTEITVGIVLRRVEKCKHVLKVSSSVAGQLVERYMQVWHLAML